MTAWISHNLSRKEHGWRYTSSPNNTRPISSLALRVPTDGRVRLQSALLSVSVSLLVSLVESSSVPETTSHAMAPHPEIGWIIQSPTTMKRPMSRSQIFSSILKRVKRLGGTAISLEGGILPDLDVDENSPVNWCWKYSQNYYKILFG